MPHFAYKSLSAEGKVVRGRVEARDAEAVRRLLQSQGAMPIETREVRSAGAVAAVLRRPASPKDLALASQELSMLLTAGQTLEQALQLMAEGVAPRPLRGPFALALARLREGASLAEALRGAGSFPPVYTAMVQAGEVSGSLGEQIGKLGAMLDRAARLREQLISALIYPALLVLVAFSAVIMLLTYVVPQFEPLFEGAKNLPFMTRAVLAASDLLREWGQVAGILLCTSVLGLAALARRPAVARRLDDLRLALPVVGPLLLLAASARWMRVLAVLLKGGVPLPQALDLVAPVAGYRRLQAMLAAVKTGIKDGKGLTAALPPGAPLPDLAPQLLKVGEQGGRLEDSLGHLADLYDTRLETRLKRLLAIFEPACVFGLSLVVGTIVISILTAVVSINDLAL